LILIDTHVLVWHERGDRRLGPRAPSVFDPADRLIVATALAGHRLMTADQRILSWPGRLCRLDAGE
jgi:PIN domain nuclease of toxin-antitoxin system